MKKLFVLVTMLLAFGVANAKRLKNSTGNTLGYVKDGRVQNSTGNNIGYYDGVIKAVDAALYFFFFFY